MRPAHEDDSISTLYEASYRGSVSTLSTLIQQDRLILHRISQTAFSETPLHISALLDHLDFTKALLTHKPQLAQEFDSFQRTPLHLASAEGHKDTVQVLLQAYDDACLKPDQDGRIPLHYAAMRGRTEVVRELIRAKPNSLSVHDRGKTVLHLCVTYNHQETLKALVEEYGDIIGEFLNSKDNDGNNTILHLAVMFKQVETIKYLLSIGIIKDEENNNKNGMGLTAIEMIEHSPKDFKSLEIQFVFMNAGIKDEKKHKGMHPQAPSASTRTNSTRYYFKKFLQFLNICLSNDGDWLKDAKETLGVVATVIATMTFQIAINPPGGVVALGGPNMDLNAKIPNFVYYGINGTQSPAADPAPASPHTQKDIYPCFYVNDEIGKVCAGDALLASIEKHHYYEFLMFNTISFITSLSVTLFLLSGIPVKHRFVMRLLSIGMCISLTCLAFTYGKGLYLLTPLIPGSGYGEYSFVFTSAFKIWTFILCFVASYNILRFAAWVAKKCLQHRHSLLAGKGIAK